MRMFDQMNAILRAAYSHENQTRLFMLAEEPFMDSEQWQAHRRKHVIRRVKSALRKRMEVRI